MKKILILSTLALTLCSTLHANTTQVANAKSKTTPTTHPICLIPDYPLNVKFTEIKRIKVAKGTYGSVTDLYPRMKDRAQHYGADAVINYHASQRFGFWPWRIVRPVATGTAIKWTADAPNCASLGGTEVK
ncbi:hypothetical protein [Acinetobacter sp. MD2]|uniref:hypothetical protein n=1 Tax=Acinetobacter sp. MD2 TaxID=2600066 RepID=UPI002D1EB973|nr:hypothetical protein [Acinetobacter sp. MD2]MEB3766140.1 hypothetical protein [Acinetobacter sp. MD2]